MAIRQPPKSSENSLTIDEDIAFAKGVLDGARAHGDKLSIELAEDALNDLLDRKLVTLETRNSKGA